MHAKANGYVLKIYNTKEFHALFIYNRASKYNLREKQKDIYDFKR